MAGERTAFAFHEHWFFLLFDAVVFLFLLFVPPGAYILAHDYIIAFELRKIFLFLAALYYFAWWNSVFFKLMMYLLNEWIVTDKRVVFNEQKGYFKRSVAELNVSKIQDIQVLQNGLFASFLNFGNLEIQTAGTQNKFLFKRIPNPSSVKNAIMKAQNDYSMKPAKEGYL